MKKPGRNDLCPCGSGKKYKKCCLQKEENERLTNKQNGEEDDLFEPEEPLDQPSEHHPNDQEISLPDLEPENELHDEDSSPEQSLPAEVVRCDLNEEESRLIDDWWEKYRHCDSFDALLNHIRSFIASYPDQVNDLELHEEPIFILGDFALREQRVVDYINFLIMFRRDFTPSYLESFGFFDEDLVYHLVTSGNGDQVPHYLNCFKQFPERKVDSLFRILDFFRATGCEDLHNDLMWDVYKVVCTSPLIMNGTAILDPLIASCYIPFLDDPHARMNVSQILERVRKIEYPLKDIYYDPMFYQELMANIDESPQEWSLKACRKRRDVVQLYERIALNFAGYLHRKHGLNWVKAFYYMDCVFDYLCMVIPPRKKPKQLFMFTRTRIADILSRNIQDFLFTDYMRILCSCSALYLFANYLEEKQAIPNVVSNDIRLWCGEFFRMILPKALLSTLSAHAFQQFPSS